MHTTKNQPKLDHLKKMTTERETPTEIFIGLNDTFDPSRIIVKDAKVNRFTKGDSEIEWVTSDRFYIDDDGNECELYFEGPPQYCFGINANYPMGTEKESQSIDTMNGLQIMYPATSMKTMETPTPAELHIQKIFSALQKAAWKKMEEECSRDEDEVVVPGPTHGSFVIAKSKKNPDLAVKPIFDFAKKKDPKNDKKKLVDREKPKRSYNKLLTKGTGRDMKCITQIYGPGDKQDKTGRKFLDVRGTVHPVFKDEGIFWGAHGKNTHGASNRIRVAQMNFTPTEDGAPKRRMLPKNTAPVEELDDSDDEEQEPEDEAFENPNCDSNDPLSALKDNDEEEQEDQEQEEEHSPPQKKKTAAQKKLLLKKKAAARRKKLQE